MVFRIHYIRFLFFIFSFPALDTHLPLPQKKGLTYIDTEGNPCNRSQLHPLVLSFMNFPFYFGQAF